MRLTVFALSAVLSAAAGFSCGCFLSVASNPSKKPNQKNSVPRWVGQTGPPAAPNALSNSLDSPIRDKSAIDALGTLEELAQWNPRRAFYFALRQSEALGDSSFLDCVLREWATSDARSAIRAWASLSDRQKGAISPSLVAAVLAENPHAIGALFATRVFDHCTDADLRSAFKHFVEEDPKHAAKWMMADTNAARLAETILPFLSVDGGIEAFVAAADKGASFSPSMETADYLLHGLSTGFKTTDDALAFADTIRNPHLKSLYQLAIVSDVANHDVAQATELYRDLLPESLQQDAAVNFTKVLATLDLNSSLEFIGSVAPSKVNDSLIAELTAITTRMGRPLTGEQLNTFLSLADRGAVDQFLAAQVMGSEIVHDNNAWTWIFEISNSELSQIGLGLIAGRNLDVNPSLASEAISRFPEGDSRDALIADLVKSIPDDPERAIQWTSIISNRQQRLATLEEISSYFLSTPRVELQSLLASLGFNSEEQTVILAPSNR